MPSPVSFRLGIPPGGAEASGEEAASPSPEADTINIIFKGRFQGVGPATHTHLHPLSRREPLPEEQLAKRRLKAEADGSGSRGSGGGSGFRESSMWAQCSTEPMQGATDLPSFLFATSHLFVFWK